VHRSTESDTARNPVNQRIVAGKPVISKYCIASRIQDSHVKRNRSYFPTGKSDRQVECLRDDRCKGSVEEFESNRGDPVSSEVVPGNESRVHKTMARSRIQEGTDDTFWTVLRSKGNSERVRI
jgi:hypothetical protein